jgi:hypothetical protein
MSGGTFDYKQYEIDRIAEEIDTYVRNNGKLVKNDYGSDWTYNLTPETVQEFKRAVVVLRQAFVYAHRIDWLMAGDDGEETFHERLAHDLAKLQDDGDT